ncbi:MAG: hypothetical protein WDM96_11525 [Lacunisphaera sp.]
MNNYIDAAVTGTFLALVLLVLAATRACGGSSSRAVAPAALREETYVPLTASVVGK